MASAVLDTISKNWEERRRLESELKYELDTQSMRVHSKRQLEEAERLTEEAKRKTEEAKRKTEEAKRKTEEAERKVEDAERKAEDAQKVVTDVKTENETLRLQIAELQAQIK